MKIVQVVCLVSMMLAANSVNAQCYNCNYNSSPVTYYSSPVVESSAVPVSYAAPASVGYETYPSYDASYSAPVYKTAGEVVYPSSTSYPATYSESVVYPSSGSMSPVVYEPVVASAPVEYAPQVSSAYVQSSAPIVQTATYQSKSSPIQMASYSAAASSGSSDQMNVLMVVNEKRRRSGLAPLMFDAALANVAQRKSNLRANRGITGHDGSNMGGASVEGVGYSYGQANPVQGFNTCYLYSNGYRSAGCAVSYDANRRAYYTLLLR